MPAAARRVRHTNCPTPSGPYTMGKLKGFIIIGIVAIVAMEIYSRFIRPRIFPAA